MNKRAVINPDKTPAFERETMLKADIFGRIFLGRLGSTGEKAIQRDLTLRKWWAAPLSAHLARREARALVHLEGVAGIPRLLHRDRQHLYRQWIPGLPMHVAAPHDDADYFAQARHILSELRKRRFTHNDLAKMQNWLRGHDGKPYLLDFQVAKIHRRKGFVYRIMAYEDLRHLLKHKAYFCPDAMSAREWAIARRRSLPSLIWRKTGKRIYNLFTRGVLHWSDGEGGGDRLVHYGEPLTALLRGHRAISEAAVASFPHHSHKVEGLYAFVVANEPVDGTELAAWTRKELGPVGGANLAQIVPALPKTAAGDIRHDLLKLVAGNLLDDIEPMTAGDPELKALMAQLIDGRVNRSDRRAKIPDRRPDAPAPI